MIRAQHDPILLRKLLRYEPDTGKLYWRVRQAADICARGSRSAQTVCNALNARRAGKEALTSISNWGYLTGAIDKRSYQAHRVIWALHYGRWPDGEIDHINRIKTDNRICNLRVASRSQNGANCHLKSTNSTGFIGVFLPKASGRWIAYARSNGRQVSLGGYGCPTAAALAYDKFVRADRGEFACPNFHTADERKRLGLLEAELRMPLHSEEDRQLAVRRRLELQRERARVAR